MLLPDFLVIGAMKAGTTTLCHDLARHPEVFFPATKEPHTLMFPEVLSPRGKARYAALFRDARKDQRRGEGSTGYTKYPHSADVPRRACDLLGSDLKLFYILRNPVDRTLSHHHHSVRDREVPASFRAAAAKNPLLITCGCYGLQLEKWLEVFPREQLHLVRFEDYMADRWAGARAAWSFLGLPSADRGIDPEQRLNVGEEQLLPPAAISGIKNRIARSQWYKRNVAPLLSSGLKDSVKKILYKKPAGKPEMPTAGDVEEMLAAFAEDLPRLRAIAGPGFPLWTPGELRARAEARILEPQQSDA